MKSKAWKFSLSTLTPPFRVRYFDENKWHTPSLEYDTLASAIGEAKKFERSNVAKGSVIVYARSGGRVVWYPVVDSRLK